MVRAPLGALLLLLLVPSSVTDAATARTGSVATSTDRVEDNTPIGRFLRSNPIPEIDVVGNDGSPSGNYPLGLCQGDCDGDGDCEGDLECWERDKNEFVPGCTGGEQFNDDIDFCIRTNATSEMAPPPIPISSQTFRLKMYYDDYCWQGDCWDPEWCAFYNYEGRTCYYNYNQAGSCDEDRLYIDVCAGNHGDDRFQFQDVGSGRILIRATDQDDKCLRRRGDRIYLDECDSNDIDQRWYSPLGWFGGDRFELSIDGDKCMSQAHHPKQSEVVELKDCDQERASLTTFWERDN